MRYTKPARTFEEQAQLLIERGLIASKEEIEERIAFVNYYRFSSYLYPFRKEGAECFKQGTRFSSVWQHYKFDRDFRSLVFNAIEVVEIALRTKITYHISHTYDPFAYTDIKHFPLFNQEDFEAWKEDICEEIMHKNDYAISHFYEKYSPEHELPPLWIACEYMTFGKIVTMYRKLGKELKTLIATDFNVPANVFRTWLLSLNDVRNVCAHHGRLWNRVLGTKPKLLKGTKYKEWEEPIKIPNDRMFGMLTILNFLIRQIDVDYRLKDQLDSLFQKYPSVPMAWMGFPQAWEDSSLWK